MGSSSSSGSAAGVRAFGGGDDPAESAGRESRLWLREAAPLVFGALVMAASFVVFRLVMHGDGIATDDTHIHLRIARNWAAGNGPVFNVGERVEASSSPLWLVLLTLGFAVHVPTLALVAIVELLAAGAAGVCTAWLGKRVGGTGPAYLAPLFLAVLPSFGVWLETGMETPLAAALLAGATASALGARNAKSGVLLGLLTAALVFTRQEAIVVLPLLVAIAVLRAPDRGQRRAIALAAGLGCLVPVALLLLARHAYYGEWVPNTYVAKVAGATLKDRLLGLPYVGRFVAVHAIAFGLAAWCIASGGRIGLRSILVEPSTAVASVAVLYLAGVAWTGGDHFFFQRLCIPVLPLVVALAAVPMVPSASGVRSTGTLVARALALLQVPWVLGVGHAQMAYTWVAQEQVRYAEQIGAALSVLPPGTVATIGIGAIGYVSERPILDLVGLADKTIARSPRIPGAKPGHQHGDVDYELSRRPEYVVSIVWVNPTPMTDEEEIRTLVSGHASLASAELLVMDPRFRARYVPLNLKAGSGYVRVWARSDLKLGGT